MSDDQKPGAQSDQSSSGNQDADDLWAAAMAEQGVEPDADDSASHGAESTTGSAQAATGKAAEPSVFPSFDQEGAGAGRTRDLGVVMDIPVKLSVELGRTRITIKQLLELAQGSVVELDGLAGEPMDILINGYLVAQGEVVVVEDKYGIRITEIITPSERVQKLNR